MQTPPPAIPFWARPAGFALIVLLLSLPRLAIALRIGLLSDEAYYALWSMYPGPGYFDHSPGIAWAVAAGRAIFGEGLLAVRSVTVVCGFIAFALLYRLGVLLFDDRRIGALAGLFYAVSVAVILSYSFAGPDGLSSLFWLATLWAVAEAEARGQPNWWLLVGAFAGLGLLSKYIDVFLAPGLLLYVLIRPARRQVFRHWQLWAGAALALLLFAPVIWWNFEHHWISFRFQMGRSSLARHEEMTGPMPFIYYWVATAMILLPPAALLVLAAVPASWRSPERGGAVGLSLPLLTSLPIVLFFALHSLVNTANPNWIDPVFAPLMLPAAWAALRLRPSQAAARWLLAVCRWAQIPVGLVFTVVLLVAVIVGELPFVGGRIFFSYGRGWDGVAAAIASKAEETGAQWVDTKTYLIGSLVAYAMVTEAKPLPVLQTNEAYRYSFRPAPSKELLAAPHLVFREVRDDTPPPLGGKHLSVTPLGVVKRSDGGHVLGLYALDLVVDAPKTR